MSNPKDGFGQPWDRDRGGLKLIYGCPPAPHHQERKKTRSTVKYECGVYGCHVCSGALAERYERREPDMKLWLMSDLHLEFESDGGERFFATLPEPEYDLAVIAGDLCDFKILKRSLHRVAEKFHHVAFTLGNHECYGGSIGTAHMIAARASQDLPNLTYLDCSHVDVKGVRVHGHALWFPYPGPHYARKAEKGMNDFYHISDYRAEVGAENQRALRYFNSNVRAGDVVISHHLPTTGCVNWRFRGSPLNAFFVGGAEQTILERVPSTWCFGHTHCSTDISLGPTRLICNPRGYYPNDLNPNFNPGLVLEV